VTDLFGKPADLLLDQGRNRIQQRRKPRAPGRLVELLDAEL